MVTYDHSQYETNDEAFLIDIGLSILGQSEEGYSEYDQQIKQKYKWIPLISTIEKEKEY